MTFKDFFAKHNPSQQASGLALAAAGFTSRQIESAVQAGRLRAGIMGYWIPAAPDPGAVLVMQRAMRERSESAEGGAL